MNLLIGAAQAALPDSSWCGHAAVTVATIRARCGTERRKLPRGVSGAGSGAGVGDARDEQVCAVIVVQRRPFLRYSPCHCCWMLGEPGRTSVVPVPSGTGTDVPAGPSCSC